MALKISLKTVMNNGNIDDTIAGDGEKYNTGVWRGIADEEEEVLLRISPGASGTQINSD